MSDTKGINSTSINILLMGLGQDSLNANSETQAAIMSGVNAKNADYERLNEALKEKAKELGEKGTKNAGFTDNGALNGFLSITVAVVLVGVIAAVVISTGGAAAAAGGAAAGAAGAGAAAGGAAAGAAGAGAAAAGGGGLIAGLTAGGASLGVFTTINSLTEGGLIDGFLCHGEKEAPLDATQVAQKNAEIQGITNQTTQTQGDISTDMQKMGTVQNMNETLQNLIQTAQKNQASLVRSNS